MAANETKDEAASALAEAEAAVPTNVEDITAFVQTLLTQMQTRFQTMSDAIISKNDMGYRIDDLERSLTDLMKEANLPDASAPVSAAVPDSDEPAPAAAEAGTTTSVVTDGATSSTSAV